MLTWSVRSRRERLLSPRTSSYQRRSHPQASSHHRSPWTWLTYDREPTPSSLMLTPPVLRARRSFAQRLLSHSDKRFGARWDGNQTQSILFQEQTLCSFKCIMAETAVKELVIQAALYLLIVQSDSFNAPNKVACAIFTRSQLYSCEIRFCMSN